MSHVLHSRNEKPTILEYKNMYIFFIVWKGFKMTAGEKEKKREREIKC